MITSLRLQNYRGFDDHVVPFSPLTIVVGRNNAGKSTIVEGLRLVAIVIERYRHLTYRRPPPGSDLPIAFYGVAPSLRNMEINFKSIFHQYREPPAIITASFSSGSTVTIYILAKERIHAVIKDPKGETVRSKRHAEKLSLSAVAIMPQVAPVQPEESILSEEYVKRSSSSNLASLHFRNQLNFEYRLFTEFKRMVESSWRGMQVRELVGRGGLPGARLALIVRNEDFAAEISAMGHGMQIWLQTMWFLTRSKNAHTVILDEPDVYMHADLQRGLLRYVRNRYPQTIMTTHSVEVMSEVSPEDILVVEKGKDSSAFAPSLPAVQRVLENVGSTQNIHLTRLWHSRRFILIEGDDLAILKHFQDTLFPDSEEALDSIPNMSIGGWGGWSYAVGSSMTLQNAFGENIITYCLLDSDYHTQEDILQRLTEATEKGVELHIWSRKELENYLLVPASIHRLIENRLAKRTRGPTVEEVARKIEETAASMEEEAFYALSAEILANNRSLGAGGANKLARKQLAVRKAEATGLPSLVSGKALISKLSKWSQDEFGVSFNSVAAAKVVTRQEIPEEVRRIVSAIQKGQPFSGNAGAR